jgi:hypothetical protein
MRCTPNVTGVVLMAAMLWGCAASDGATTSDPPACESIETLARQLVDVGITYDYEPSNSPAELAERVDVVIRGELTGEVVDQSASSDAGNPYVGYEISVDEVLAGELPDGSGSVIVSVAYNSSLLDADPFAEAATPGVPVIVFAYVAPDTPGGFRAAVIEGFMTACEGGAPIGWVGQLGEWSSMTSLDDVAAAVTSGTE